MLYRLVRRKVMDHPCDRRNQPIRISAGVHKHLAAKHQLLEGMIDSHLGLGYDVLVVEIAKNAHNAHGLRSEPRDELYHRVGPRDMAVDGVLIGKHALRNTLADDHHVLSAQAVGLVEIASGNNGNPECGEIYRHDGAKVGALIFFTGVADMSFGGELQAWAEAATITPRHTDAEGDGLHARKL